MRRAALTLTAFAAGWLLGWATFLAIGAAYAHRQFSD